MRYFAKYVSIFILACLAAGLFATNAQAKTIIRVNEAECTINVTLHKEFYLHTSNWLDHQIEFLKKEIRAAKEILRLLPVSTKTTTQREMELTKKRIQRDIEDLEGRLEFVERERKEFKEKEAQAKKDLAKKAAEWAKGIEDEWNGANYEYHCCKVRFTVKWKVGNEGAAPTQGYDQIAVSAVPSHRSYIDFGGNGFDGFDADGFAHTPYGRDLSGEWRYDADGFTAAHEACHEMGLDDQYKDIKRDGKTVSVPNPGHENDIRGTRRGTPVSKGASGNVVDNIGLILKKRYIQCPPECCKKPKTPVTHDKTGKDKGLVEDKTKGFEVWDQSIKEKIPEGKGGEKVQ